MPQVFKLRARLRSSHLGALGIALLFWGAVSQTIYVVGSIIAEGCIRLIDLYIHTSPRMYTLLNHFIMEHADVHYHDRSQLEWKWRIPGEEGRKAHGWIGR